MDFEAFSIKGVRANKYSYSLQNHYERYPMNETTSFTSFQQESPEVQFAKVLENYQLSGSSASPFDVVQNFVSICAGRALAAQHSEDGSINQEFDSWDLETKLWHLFYVLYSFRLSVAPPQADVPSYVSDSLKRENFFSRNPKIRELLLIIQWIQQNSNDVIIPEECVSELKWSTTKVAIETKALASLANKARTDLVNQLDVDAPLRSGGKITEQDAESDQTCFKVIYDLLLSGQNQEAINYAAQSGNYTLSLILVGAFQDYVDPVIDDLAVPGIDVEEDESVVITEPSGTKHKYLWYQTVNKLAKDPRISKFEALIYSFLLGGDLAENIKLTSTWESHMLLYVNQLLTHHLRNLLKMNLTDDRDEMISNIIFAAPQHQSVDGILNTLQNTSAISAASKNPFRVIMGSVIIDQLLLFLHNSSKSADSQIVEDKHILRVLAHLAVVSVILGIDEGSKSPTRMITRYISRLSESGLDDLVPVYLSFIPDEKDVRECYSIFLTTIVDSDKRNRQLEILRRLGTSAFSDNATLLSSNSEELDDQYESKIHNVLKRTVERVMLETLAHYELQQDIQLREDEIDEVDVKLSRSVDWFYENFMYEDAVLATLTVFRRFLTTGRLRAIKEFCAGKDFKTLLKKYDSSVQIRSLEGASPVVISDSEKEELLHYDDFGRCLDILDEWKTFLGPMKETHWISKDVEKFIEKITLHLSNFILTWLRDAIQHESCKTRIQLYEELRSLYIPYVLIELLQILQQCRLHDWKYMHQAFSLVNEVANDGENDYLRCFLACGRIGDFVTLAANVAMVAAEKGIKGIFT